MKKTIATPRPEHPRPDFQRPTFFNLNGEWQFAFDDADTGLGEKWYQPGKALEGAILVPFCYQSEASGIGGDEIHPILWYRRSFDLPQDMQGQRVLLRFGAVDYKCGVYLNGELAGTHVGGYTPFALEITHLLKDKGNDLCLRVEDAPDVTQPRGKQHWERGVMGCWYTPTSGIWQTVYLEAVGDYALTQIHITPDIDHHQATFEMALDKAPQEPLMVEVKITHEGSTIRRLLTEIYDRQIRIPVDMIAKGTLDPVHIWSPQHPHLYDVRVRVQRKNQTLDEVTTYFGMRKVEVKNGQVLLNNSPLYQRLILDQGYWPDTLLTPPTDEAIQEDIRLTMALGYNGARKHQKIEDPRYYYWADKMGLLVWGEVPSPYDFADETVRNLAETLAAFIDRDFNHPCIIAWVPLNESWGVRQIYANRRQQATARMLYHLAKAADGTRMVSTNDGWEQTVGDITALHDYAAEKDTMARHFAERREVERTSCDVRMAFACGETPTGEEAFIVTEYGGIAMDFAGHKDEIGGMQTWGYHDKVDSEEAFFERFQGITDAVLQLPYCQGYCYTQLTDVMQEVNGLLSPERKPRIDVQRFCALNRRKNAHQDV